MGGLAVLHPQDCLRDPHPHPPHKSLMSPPRNPNPNPNPTRSNRRKQTPQNNKNNKARQTMSHNLPSKNLVMGQVKILKRGEELTIFKSRDSGADDSKPPDKEAGDLDDLLVSSTARLGPEPEMVPKQMRLGDFYAGSVIIESPPPSSLPLPAFFSKKSVLSSKDDDDATLDLRRLLRLNLP
ncbi:hypothetical protein ACSBR2_040118 [Camellia fascicularis]